MNRDVTINGRAVGPGKPCYVIAEIGVNHNGSAELAIELVDAAARAGACAVKFQTFRAEALTSAHAPMAEYQRAADPAGSQREMLKRLELTWSDHRLIYRHCRELGIDFLSSPFDEECADFLDGLGVATLKIPSGEITNLPLLQHVSRLRKPIILSTGMSTLSEVATAVDTIADSGCSELVLLHCVSRYPADPEDANLRAMATIAARFAVPVGYSDHTLGNEVSYAAAALGATVIEKHFTLDRNLPGPDQYSSSDPEGFASLVLGIRKIEAALGSGEKLPVEGEKETAMVARKSLVARVDIPAGTEVAREMVSIQRPGSGIPPAGLSRIVGTTARTTVPSGSILREEDFE
jgi:N,N'-diacetyllegionaminate synthase